MPKTGLEPVLLSEAVFETTASANSATRALEMCCRYTKDWLSLNPAESNRSFAMSRLSSVGGDGVEPPSPFEQWVTATCDRQFDHP